MNVRKTFQNKRSGLTFTEVVISTFLMGMVLVVSVRSLAAVVQTWQINADIADADALARDLLMEITSQSYVDPDETPVFGIESSEPSAPTNRLSHDDLDDYDGWSSSPPKRSDGVALSEFNGWTRTATVEKFDPTTQSPLPSSSADTGLRRVTVTVTEPSGRTISVSELRTDVAGTQQQNGVDQTSVRWIGIDLQSGSTGRTHSSGTALSNHVEAP